MSRFERTTVTGRRPPIPPLTAECSPWNDFIRCPLIIYTVLVVIGLISNVMFISRAPNVNNTGQPITNGQKWVTGIIGLLIYLLIAYLFGRWIYSLCSRCEVLNSWLVFLLAIFFPLILSIIVGLTMGLFLGISMIPFR